MTQQPHNYSISTDKSKLNFNVIYNFIANSYWAKGIPKSVMQKAIDNSMCFGVYSPNNEQVGFARVVTDNATFCLLGRCIYYPAPFNVLVIRHFDATLTYLFYVVHAHTVDAKLQYLDA